MAQPWLNDPLAKDAQPLPDGSVILNLPQSPQQQREEARKADDAARDAEDQAMQRAAEARSAEDQALRRASDDRQQAQFEGMGGKLTESEGKAVGFYQRMRSSNTDLDRLKLGPQDLGTLLAIGMSPNVSRQALTDERRSQLDAIDNFIAASLRLESGAAIGPAEYEKQFKIFFPQPGAGPEEVAQKIRQRELAILGMRSIAGKAGSIEADTNLSKLGYLDKDGNPVIGEQGGKPGLQVAEGGTFATDQDIAIARQLQERWNAGATPEQMEALSIELTGKTLGEDQLKTLRENIGGKVNFGPANSGTKEPGGGISEGLGGGLASLAAGSVRGYTANMAEEMAPLLGLDPAKVQAALDAYQEKNPIANFVGEVVGGVVSPASKLIKGGKAAQIGADAAYGAIYGAGEGDENATLTERALGAGVGAVTGGAASYGAGKLFGPKVTAVVDEALPDAAAPVATQAGEEVIKEGAEGIAPDAAQIAQLARQAVGAGPGTAKAKRELARLAKANPEAQAAAERLGVELPPDILSDNAQLGSMVGMARSQVGSEAETAWKGKVAEVSQRADDALAELGATADLAQASDDVFQRLNGSMESLQRQGDELRTQVNDAIDVRERVDASKLQESVAGVINDYGGLTEAKQAMTGEERRLLAMLGEGEEVLRPTYARLNTMRDQIGRALNKNEGPWADTPRANLARYYAALADDQIAHIEAVAGAEVADQMRASNTLFKKMYDARADMQEVFGRDLDKSLAPLLSRAITQGGKGDAQALKKLISRVPEDMRGPLLASGLMAQAQGKGAQGGFSFANYTKAYRGLRDNKPVYQTFAKSVGPAGDRILADLYAISRRMSEADGNVLRTGKANQALLALNAERLLSRVMKGTAVRFVGTVGAGAVGGPVAGGLAMATQELLARGGTAKSDKLHRLLASNDFRNLMERVATGEGVEAATNRLAGSKVLREYLPKSVGDPKAWLRAATAIGSTSALPEPPKIEIGK